MTGGHPSQETVRDRDVRDVRIGGYALFLVNDAGLRVVPLPAAGALVIGRGADADVCVADGRMSRRHLLKIPPPEHGREQWAVSGASR